MARAIKKADGLAGGIMALGALNSGLIGLAKLNMMSRIFGRKSMFMRAAYGLIGLAAIYKTARLLIPKSKHQRRLEKIDKALRQFEQIEGNIKALAAKKHEMKNQLKNMKGKNSGIKPIFSN